MSFSVDRREIDDQLVHRPPNVAKHSFAAESLCEDPAFPNECENRARHPKTSLSAASAFRFCQAAGRFLVTAMHLRDLSDCFEGVIASIIAAADGMPAHGPTKFAFSGSRARRQRSAAMAELRLPQLQYHPGERSRREDQQAPKQDVVLRPIGFGRDGYRHAFFGRRYPGHRQRGFVPIRRNQ